MRLGLLAVALVLTPAMSRAADPPIVFQTQPIGQILDDIRAAGRQIGGERAAKALNRDIEQWLGPKGFDGLDLTRPVVGYILVPEDPLDFTIVLALPVTGEKEFVDFCVRWNRLGPRVRPDGLMELPALRTELTALGRIVDGYAYIATGLRAPVAALDPKNIIPAGKLFDPAEQAIASGRVYFDRFPAGSREMLGAYLGLLKLIEAEGRGRGVGRGERAIMGSLLPRLVTLGRRYLELSKGAKTLVGRLTLNPATTDLRFEATLTTIPGSPLDKLVAAHKPTTNTFGGLLTPDAAVGFRTRLPLFAPELQATAIDMMQELQRAALDGAPPAGKVVMEELVKGLTRTVKTGELDVVGVVRGPDKNGKFTAIGAIAFDDPAALEKAFRKFLGTIPLPMDDLTWDAAKVGTVSVHQYSFAGGQFPNDLRRTFGEKGAIAFAAAPHGVFVVVGPDPMPVMKQVLAQKPVPAPVLSVQINPAKLMALAGAMGGPRNEQEMVRAFGKADKPFTALFMSVEGGKELKLTIGVNLRMFPQSDWLNPRPGPEPGQVPMFKK